MTINMIVQNRRPKLLQKQFFFEESIFLSTKIKLSLDSRDLIFQNNKILTVEQAKHDKNLENRKRKNRPFNFKAEIK